MKENITLSDDNALGSRDIKLPNYEQIYSVGLSNKNVFIQTKNGKLYGYGGNRCGEFGTRMQGMFNTSLVECIYSTQNKQVIKIIPFSDITFVKYKEGNTKNGRFLD